MDGDGGIGGIEFVDSPGDVQIAGIAGMIVIVGRLVISNKQQFLQWLHRVGKFDRVRAFGEGFRDGHPRVRVDHGDDPD